MTSTSSVIVGERYATEEVDEKGETLWLYSDKINKLVLRNNQSIVCSCSGCSPWDGKTMTVATGCRNMRNGHCLECECRYCICVPRYLLGHEAYLTTCHYDSRCSHSEGCPSCENMLEWPGGLSKIKVQRHTSYYNKLVAMEIVVRAEITETGQEYDPCEVVKRVHEQNAGI